MVKFIKSLPMFVVLVFGATYFVWMSLTVLGQILRFMLGVNDPFAKGVVLSLLLGFACSLVCLGLYKFIKNQLWFLGTSLVYVGAFMVSWLGQYGIPFFNRWPYRFSLSRDYMVLLIVSLLSLGIHYAIEFWQSPTQRAAVWNFIRKNF